MKMTIEFDNGKVLNLSVPGNEIKDVIMDTPEPARNLYIVEELAELQCALSKAIRCNDEDATDNLYEEIVDVLIALMMLMSSKERHAGDLERHIAKKCKRFSHRSKKHSVVFRNGAARATYDAKTPGIETVTADEAFGMITDAAEINDDGCVVMRDNDEGYYIYGNINTMPEFIRAMCELINREFPGEATKMLNDLQMAFMPPEIRDKVLSTIADTSKPSASPTSKTKPANYKSQRTAPIMIKSFSDAEKYIKALRKKKKVKMKK